MWKSRLFPVSLLLVSQAVAHSQPLPRQGSIPLLQEQIRILEQQREHTLIPEQRDRLTLQILSFQRQIIQEQERQEREAQRQQERQEREQQQRIRNQITLANLQDLLILQQEELERIQQEYDQLKQLYPLGLVPEAQWNIVQRRLNVQRERIQRTNNQIQDLLN